MLQIMSYPKFELEVEQYNKYAKLINQLSGGKPENHEDAFKQLGPLILPNPSEPKRLQQKITDLYNVINDLCHPETGDISNVLQTARYYNGLYDYEVLRFEPGRYDPRFEKNKDFTGCRFLLYDSIKLTGINERWFLAEGLLTLVIKNCNVFIKLETLEIFGKKIGKFKHLTTLELSNCKLDKIPEMLLQNLSKSIIELILFDNNISVIPSLISRLVNLEVLNLNNNPELDDAGIPWNALPESLMFLEIKNTKITKIPNETKKLSRLRALNVQGPNLKEIDWDGITEGLEKLSISNLLVFNRTTATEKRINSFFLSDENLTGDRSIIIPSYVRELNLSNNKLQFTTFNFRQPPFSLLKILILSKNLLSSIPWEVLPSTLEHLDLSQNTFKEIESVKNLINIKEFLMSDNRIFKITAEFNELKKLKIIDLSRNALSSLPKGFEFIFSNYLTVKLNENKFNYKNGNIKEDLWNRLPSTLHLNLSQNVLGELPCQLIGKIMELQAIDCNLKYICPQIYAKFYDFNDRRYNIFRQRLLLNIAKNDDLKNLSFIPRKIYSAIPLSTEKPTDEHRYFSRAFDETQLLTTLNVCHF
uniref:Leucine rich repeat protein n=1 Tax=Panagrolaimus sp. ES5 TaxID=591445 RepID=A0AC34FF76_9BILA